MEELTRDELRELGRLRTRMKGTAASMVKKAQELGVLPALATLACVDCGKPATGFDHRSYVKPLDVEPVCRGCNYQRGPARPILPSASLYLWEVAKYLDEDIAWLRANRHLIERTRRVPRSTRPVGESPHRGVLLEGIREGDTLEQIGQRLGLTRERIRQLIASLGLRAEFKAARRARKDRAIAAKLEAAERLLVRDKAVWTSLEVLAAAGYEITFDHTYTAGVGRAYLRLNGIRSRILHPGTPRRTKPDGPEYYRFRLPTEREYCLVLMPDQSLLYAPGDGMGMQHVRPRGFSTARRYDQSTFRRANLPCLAWTPTGELFEFGKPAEIVPRGTICASRLNGSTPEDRALPAQGAGQELH